MARIVINPSGRGDRAIPVLWLRINSLIFNFHQCVPGSVAATDFAFA